MPKQLLTNSNYKGHELSVFMILDSSQQKTVVSVPQLEPIGGMSRKLLDV